MRAARHQLKLGTVGDYLSALAEGERSIDTVTAIALEVAQAAKAAGLAKILVDVRQLQGHLRLIDGYLVVNGVFENLRGTGLRRAAIVDRPTPRPGMRFIETIARNRGFEFRVFDDPERALRWLSQPEG